MKQLNNLIFVLGYKNTLNISINEETYTLVNDPFSIPCKLINICCYKFIYILYNLTIFCILLVEPLFILLDIIHTKDIINIPKFCFLIISPCQFIIGKNYFSKNHFKIIYKHIKGTKLTFFNNEKKILISTLVLSVFSMILSLYVFIYDINNNGFIHEPLFIHMGYFGIIVQFISWIYGRSIIFFNLTVFFTIFSHHKKELDNITLILSDKDWLNSEQFIVSDLCYQILKIKTKLEESISNLESIYTFSTMFGTIGVGVFFQAINEFNNIIFIIICISIFFCIQIIFIYYMYNLANKRKQLLKIIQSSKFTKAFLKRNGKKTNTPKDPFKTLITIQKMSKLKNGMAIGNLNELKLSPIKSNNNIVRTPDWVRDNGSSIDWIVLYTILKERWITFSFFGLTFEDGDAFKKGIALSAMLVAANNLNIT